MNYNPNDPTWLSQSPVPPPPPMPPEPPHAQKKKKSLAIGCGTLVGILALCGICNALGLAGGSTKQAPAPLAPVAAKPTHQVLSLATVLVKTPTPTPKPRPTPAPTATPTPTPEPVQQQVPPPAAAPPTGVNGNPWGYDFSPGSYITDPPTDFCTYFNCIASFWKGAGHVEECSDGAYSKSGGLTGSCSRHGGDYRPLYQHP